MCVFLDLVLDLFQFLKEKYWQHIIFLDDISNFKYEIIIYILNL